MKKFSNVSDFELRFSNASEIEIKILQRVRFWIENFLTRRILKIGLHSTAHVPLHFVPQQQHILLFLCIFKNHNFELKNQLHMGF